MPLSRAACGRRRGPRATAPHACRPPPVLSPVQTTIANSGTPFVSRDFHPLPFRQLAWRSQCVGIRTGRAPEGAGPRRRGKRLGWSPLPAPRGATDRTGGAYRALEVASRMADPREHGARPPRRHTRPRYHAEAARALPGRLHTSGKSSRFPNVGEARGRTVRLSFSTMGTSSRIDGETRRFDITGDSAKPLEPKGGWVRKSRLPGTVRAGARRTSRSTAIPRKRIAQDMREFPERVYGQRSMRPRPDPRFRSIAAAGYLGGDR